MPGRNKPQTEDGLCRRCHEQEVAINVRAEPLCRDCFAKYAQTKVVKRLETFRVRNSDENGERILLLPYSLGPCSTALLHILSQHRKGQAEKTRRTGFKLHVLHIRIDLEDDDSMATASDDDVRLERLKARYPEHTYSVVPLSSIFSEPKLLPSNIPQSLHDDNNFQSNQARVAALLSSPPTPTARTDLSTHLIRKLIHHHAAAISSAAILYGHSTTRLAEITLSETAKGRGGSVPALTGDGSTASNTAGIPVYHPARDLLSKEIASYIRFLDPAIAKECVKWEDPERQAVSAKNATIDGLMRQYFEGVEVEYPSIVANVVRTTGKLEVKGVEDGEERCELCGMGLGGRAPDRSRLCWGCIRTLPETAE